MTHRRGKLLGALALGFALTASLVTVPTTASAHPGSPGGLDHRALQQTLDGVVEAGAPGAMAEARHGWWRWPGSAGVADVHTDRPVLPHMRHRVGSITKTFVATTLLQLVGEGRLDLADRVGRWLPDLVGPTVGEQVTVRMLLNHTSGIGNYTNVLLSDLEGAEQLGTVDHSPRELVEIGLAMPRTNPPGERFSYSNTNYILAGLILERVTGRDAADVVDRRIIRPLRLRHTYFPGDQRHIRGPHMAAYFAPLGLEDRSVQNMSWAWMAGELVSTTADLNRFYRALLDGRLLRPAELAEMQTTVPMNPDVPAAGGYGLGLYSLATPCGPAWGHDGGVLGQITVSLHRPDASRHVTFAMNISHYQESLTEPHPIDLAYNELLVTALCPEPPASTFSTAPRLEIPELPHL